MRWLEGEGNSVPGPARELAIALDLAADVRRRRRHRFLPCPAAAQDLGNCQPGRYYLGDLGPEMLHKNRR